MVDMESYYHPPSPLGDSVLGSPLCADDDFMGSMEELQDISQSIDNDTLSSLDVPDYQPSSNGSEGSAVVFVLLLFVIIINNNTLYLPSTFRTRKAAQGAFQKITQNAEYKKQ